MSDQANKEFSAMKTVYDVLEPLEVEARNRVLTYITSLLGIAAKAPVNRVAPSSNLAPEKESGQPAPEEQAKNVSSFANFAELYAATSPKTNGEKALVVGYWLQVCNNTENFTAAAANKDLTHLGHKVTNITDAIDKMKSQKPALILQLKKSGNSRQARKLYKISVEGQKRVEAMING